MDARTKALKAHRKRLRARKMKRVEVTVHERDAPLIRRLAAELRRDDQATRRIRAALDRTAADEDGPTVAKVMDSLPDVSGSEFDKVFEEIERLRHDPVMMRVRDVDL
jgi:hypothetical protein